MATIKRDDIIRHYKELGVYIGESDKSIRWNIDLRNYKLIQEAEHFLGVWMGLYNTKRMNKYSFFMRGRKNGSSKSE